MEKLQFSQKMAILPIFTLAKRPTGRNGAVGFLSTTDSNKSYFTHKKFQMIIPCQFLVTSIWKMIYSTKRAFFEKKWLFPRAHYQEPKSDLVKMWHNYIVKNGQNTNFAPWCETHTYFDIYMPKMPMLGQKWMFLRTPHQEPNLICMIHM